MTYKKIILSLMFLPIFSSTESLCVDPIIISAAAYIIAQATVAVINNTGSTINNTYRYFYPTPIDEANEKAIIANAEAATAASKADKADAQIDIEKTHIVLNCIETGKKFRKCAAESKPDSEKTVIGIPIQCQELARIFLVCDGGKEELTKTITDLEEFGS